MGISIGCWHDSADGDIVAQGAFVVLACDAAVVTATGIGERGCTGAVADGAFVVAAHNAAVVVGVGLDGGN